MKNCIELSNVLNDLGNALTAAKWPVATCIRFDGAEQVYDLKEVYKRLIEAANNVMHDADDLKDCANELCLMCGAYKLEHEGSCNSCRWLEARKKR